MRPISIAKLAILVLFLTFILRGVLIFEIQLQSVFSIFSLILLMIFVKSDGSRTNVDTLKSSLSIWLPIIGINTALIVLNLEDVSAKSLFISYFLPTMLILIWIALSTQQFVDLLSESSRMLGRIIALTIMISLSLHILRDPFILSDFIKVYFDFGQSIQRYRIITMGHPLNLFGELLPGFRTIELLATGVFGIIFYLIVRRKICSWDLLLCLSLSVLFRARTLTLVIIMFVSLSFLIEVFSALRRRERHVKYVIAVLSALPFFLTFFLPSGLSNGREIGRTIYFESVSLTPNYPGYFDYVLKAKSQVPYYNPDLIQVFGTFDNLMMELTLDYGLVLGIIMLFIPLIFLAKQSLQASIFVLVSYVALSLSFGSTFLPIFVYLVAAMSIGIRHLPEDRLASAQTTS